MIRHTYSDALWKRTTSTVGLVVVRDVHGLNVMSAEWTYFVAKEPLMVAVVVHEENHSSALLRERSEFSVTMCSDDQAGIADFCGSFSGRDISKLSSDDIKLRPAAVNGVDWIDGGVLALECVTKQRIALPHYSMIIGEVVAAHEPPLAKTPLVKHGAMHRLGDPVTRASVIAGASLVRGERPNVRVSAVSGECGMEEFRVALLSKSEECLLNVSVAGNEFGDLDTDLEISEQVASRLDHVAVFRSDLVPGIARV